MILWVIEGPNEIESEMVNTYLILIWNAAGYNMVVNVLTFFSATNVVDNLPNSINWRLTCASTQAKRFQSFHIKFKLHKIERREWIIKWFFFNFKGKSLMFPLLQNTNIVLRVKTEFIFPTNFSIRLIPEC